LTHRLSPRWTLLRTAPEARAYAKRMLNQQYPPIDYEPMFASLQLGREPGEGMATLMEKREPGWVPEGLPV